jgi:subtilisin family serine protease
MGTAAERFARWSAVAGLLAICLLVPLAPAITPGARGAATPDSESLTPASDDPVRERTETLEHLGAADWHRHGERGHGVKIAILDSGFRGYRDYLGHALPVNVEARSFRSDGKLEARDSQHGILCAEVVHALAPDSELMLANWEPDRPDQFLQAVRWARHEGARVLTCSVIMPAWSDGEGHGEVHRVLANLLGSGAQATDMLCFASAGNTAQRHWCGLFHDGGDGWHAWADGVTANLVRPWGAERVSVELCAAPGGDLEVTVQDVTADQEVGRSAARGSKLAATVRFTPRLDHNYCLRVRHLHGQAGFFHLVVLGGSLQYTTPHGSIPFPGDGPEVIAVGAVDNNGHRLAYSSCGPNSDRPKPDFVAAVPFPSLWRPRPFSGTSAAAPQAAALAALIFSRHPDWTALQVRKALEVAAEDLGPPGHDWETGFGRIRLP